MVLIRNSFPPGYSEEQRGNISESARRWLLTNAPRTFKELYQYFGHIYGLWFAYKPVCEHHKAPMIFLAEAYFQLYQHILAMAAKGTGKTQGLACLHHANSRFKSDVQTFHIGSTSPQAGIAQEYGRKLISKQPEFGAEVIGTPLQTKTNFKNGSRIEVHPGTLAQVSGPHPQIAVIDELDQVDWQVYQHFSKTPHENPSARAQVIMASTRFDKFGTVTRLQEIMGKTLRTVPWCTYDTMARCHYDCHNMPLAEDGGQCPLYERKMPDGTTEPLCHGKAHNGTGHLSVEEVILQYRGSDYETWRTVQQVDEPGSEGSFFKELSHEKRYVREEYQYVPGRPVYLAVDFGYDNFCMGAWQIRPKDQLMYQFDQIYVHEITTPAVFEILDEKPWLKDVKHGWPDPSDKNSIGQLRDYFLKKIGRPVLVWNTNTDRISGWSAVRRRLWTPAGGVLLGWNPVCMETYKDMRGLVKKEGTEDCKKVNDHGADQTRYLVYNLEAYLGISEDIARGVTLDEQQEDAARERARSIAAEQAIERLWNTLVEIGVPVERLKRMEANAPSRRQFAILLDEALKKYTLKGRLERAGIPVSGGIEGYRPEEDDFEDD